MELDASLRVNQLRSKGGAIVFEMLDVFDLGSIEERGFKFPETEEQVDELLEWAGEESRVALLADGDHRGFAMMSVATFNRIEDAMLKDSYLPHWELRGFAVEDMPTVSNLLWAANESLLMECVRDLLRDAPSPSGNADISGAVSHAKSMLRCLKDFEYDSCDEDPHVVMPVNVYRNAADASSAAASVEVRAFPLAELEKEHPAPTTSSTRFWWSGALGYKAWFGGFSIRDTHRALAWLVCKLLRNSFVDYGIWLGELPDEQPSDYVRGLNEAAASDLRDRAQSLLARIVPIEELVSVSFDVDEETLKAFEAVCHDAGLSVQNALHIAALRFIDDPEGFMERCKR